MKNKTKMLSIVLAIVMILTSVSIGVPTFAASKPSATQITSIKAIHNGFKVKWKKKSCTGYQVQYSTSKKFTSKTSKTLKVNKAKTTSKTVKKLKAKKKYYVRVRTYKTVKKKNYYSKWSANYSVTTKAKKGSSSSSSSVPTIKSISYLDKGYGFKLTWSKVSKAYGYEIQYSTDKNFSDVYDKDTGYPYLGHYLEVGKNKNTVNFKIDEKDPAGDETWYVRIRAKKNQGSLTTKVKYTGWSKTISILTPERKDYLRLMDKAYGEMGIVATDSDFDKLVKIQKWIDYNWYYDRDTIHNDAISVYQLAKYHHNGCNSFAICFNYFANKAGIQSYDIGGCPANKNIEGHHWNYICINGYWYQYDCESDPNPNKSPSGKPYYRTRFYSEKMIEFYILDNKSQIIYNNNIPHGTDYRYYDQQIQNAIGYEYHYN
jgi:hypothetical protein